MSSESSMSGRVRASDAEREEYAAIIREAVGEGRLTLAEGEERLGQVYAAKVRDELRPLIADLPRGNEQARDPRMAGPHGPRDWRPGPFGWHAAMLPDGADRRYRPGLVRHGAFLLVVSAILVGLWAITTSTFFWPAIPLSIFAIVLVRRAFGFGWYHRRWYR
jgi:hypothetical protein